MVCGVALPAVLRTPPVVHVYNVVEHGRRYRRSLVFSSDARWCLHNLESSRSFLFPLVMESLNFSSNKHILLFFCHTVLILYW